MQIRVFAIDTEVYINPEQVTSAYKNRHDIYHIELSSGTDYQVTKDSYNHVVDWMRMRECKETPDKYMPDDAKQIYNRMIKGV